MSYLFSLDISQDIPNTKMKTEIMRDQLPNCIRFIIDFVLPWPRIELKAKVAVYYIGSYMV